MEKLAGKFDGALKERRVGEAMSVTVATGSPPIPAQVGTRNLKASGDSHELDLVRHSQTLEADSLASGAGAGDVWPESARLHHVQLVFGM